MKNAVGIYNQGRYVDRAVQTPNRLKGIARLQALHGPVHIPGLDAQVELDADVNITGSLDNL